MGENPYLWEKPATIAKRLEQILAEIEFKGYGGGGKEAVTQTYARIYSWYDPLYHFGYHDQEESPEAYEYVRNVCLLDKWLPSYVWRPLRILDVGYRTLVHVACGHKVFWLCQDCGAPLIYDEHGEGCPFCADTFPQSRKNRIDVSKQD